MQQRELPEGRGPGTDRIMRYLIEQTGADVVIDHADTVPDGKLVHIGYYAERKKVQSVALSIAQAAGLKIIQAGVDTTRADPDLPHVESVGRYSQDDGKERGWFEAKRDNTTETDGRGVPDGY